VAESFVTSMNKMFHANCSEVTTWDSAAELPTTSPSADTARQTVSAQVAGTVGMIVSSIAVIANALVLV